MKTLNVKKLFSGAALPTRHNPEDAGLDLYAVEDVPYRPGELVVVPTAVAMEIDPGYVGLICDRSSMGKRQFKVMGGVIDAGYRGDITVMLKNLSDQHGCIRKGERIAQMLIVPVALPVVREVKELSGTSRGTGGFGSSGS